MRNTDIDKASFLVCGLGLYLTCFLMNASVITKDTNVDKAADAATPVAPNFGVRMYSTEKSEFAVMTPASSTLSVLPITLNAVAYSEERAENIVAPAKMEKAS